MAFFPVKRDLCGFANSYWESQSHESWPPFSCGSSWLNTPSSSWNEFKVVVIIQM